MLRGFPNSCVYVCFFSLEFLTEEEGVLSALYGCWCWYRTEEFFYETFWQELLPAGGLCLLSAFDVRLAHVQKESVGVSQVTTSKYNFSNA